MLNKLSEKFSKEIALIFISILLISDTAYAKMQMIRISKINIHSNIYDKRIASKGFIQKNITSEQHKNKRTNYTSSELDIDKKNLELSAINQPEKLNIGGPSQPEMSSFKSVGADNLVSPFTGDFSYNIPLLDVGGYPVNMFYNSGITMDQDASWVGLGWNINPGTVNRNMRGLPDDFDGTDVITKRQSTRPDKTWGINGGVGLKALGNPIVGLGLDVNLGLSYNNKLGIATDVGIHPSFSLSLKNSDEKTSSLTYGAEVGANLNLNSRNGASITPSINFSITKNDADYGGTAYLGGGYTYSSRLGVQGMHLNAGLSMSRQNAYQNLNGDLSSVSGKVLTLNSQLSFLYPTVIPSINNIYTRNNYNLNFSLGGELFGIYPSVKIGGYYSESYIAEKDKETFHPAYGYLHFENSNTDKNALLDFNRVNDGVYTPNSPATGMPIYTYDIFSISGEGTGGTFRAYRNDIGFMHDANTKTKDFAGSLSLDLGFGNVIHGGGEFSKAFTPTEVGGWVLNNGAANLLNFKESNGKIQAAYFKNPGEKTIPDIDFQNSIGEDKLVRFKLVNVKSGTPLLTPNLIKFDKNQNKIGEQLLTATNLNRQNPDKRTQVITFLTSEEAERVGFNKKIYSYDTSSNKLIFSTNCNKDGIDSINRTNKYNLGTSTNPNYAKTDTFRQLHHISEIDVLGEDGKKYIYGLPVYNTKQVDVTFSVNNGDRVTGKSSYTPGIDDTKENKNGRDWYMQQETMPAYTHSFLLTELISPNYVDVTGNGVSDDDIGDAIKFNYSKFNSGYKWRTPIGGNTAAYNEGLKTDEKDDKAHYTYGERELWLLYSIESKNMVARFYTKNDRKDCRQVTGSEGFLDENNGMQRLYKISLFSKGDLVKYGNNAKAIKTVQFFHSYKLCIGAENSIPNYGKLTLDSIWITYNGNNKKAKNKYVFYYPTDNNPNYSYNGNDRWGNYKSDVENNQGLTNGDFPYTTQNKLKTDKYASAWTMNKILLPSGGVMNIEYESDDYAYVQNKKAANLYGIVGFGKTATPVLTSNEINKLYDDNGDNDFIYIQLPKPITGNDNSEILSELSSRYFENTKQLYIKIAVTMPSGKGIPGKAGTEIIPVYCDIESFGLVNSTTAWVKVKKLINGFTPMTQQSLQFLKQQMPGKAYQGYDVSEQSNSKAIVIALAGMITSITALLIGDDKALKKNLKCREVQLNHSFARLNNPYLKKLGGGLRVKKVLIKDNWNKMTNQYDATYGQEYKYTKKELINNKLCEISSGVASWEPSIGGDENPFKLIMGYMDHNKGGPYDFGAVELPLGEALFPTPYVGYSKIEILSIHRDSVKNLPSREVKEFYTTKEFPFVSSCTPLSDAEANVRYQPSAIKQLLNLNRQKSITLSQGFLIEMNDMNGKEKINSTYSALDSIHPISYTHYYYNVDKATDSTYKFNHVFPTINSAQGIISNLIIGRDIEIMTDFRQHKSEIFTTNISPNFDFFQIGPFPVPLNNLFHPVIYESETYRSASVLKIVNRYGVLDSVVSIDKGSMVSTKNLVYDGETGNAIVTRTNNEFNKPVYNFNYPAHWAYSGMGGAYKNIDAAYKGLNFSHGKLMNMPNELATILESGDEIYTVAKNNFSTIDFVAPCDANAGSDPWTTLEKSTTNKIWAINTSKVGSTTPQWIFMDKDGNPYNAKDAYIRIIRSGHKNMLDQAVGSLTSLSNPIVNGQLVFNDATNIVQTSAATFKDHWKVDNSFYLVDSLVRTETPATINTVNLAPVSKLSIVFYHCYNNGNSDDVVALGGQNYFLAQEKSYGTNRNSSRHFISSWAKYDFSGIPANATIVSAKLNLLAHQDLPIPYNLNNRINHFLSNTNNGCTSTGIDDANHFYNNPHSSASNNSFRISRIIKDWSGSNNTSSWWRDYLGNPIYTDPFGIVGTTATGYNTQSFSSTLIGDSGCIDNRFDVSAMVSQMNKERNKPAVIRLELNSSVARNYNLGFDRTEFARVCFSPPALNISYYVCEGEGGLTNGGEVVENNLSTPNSAIPSSYCNNYPQFYCINYVHRYFCLSKFTQKKSINPYAEGILGNWRIDSTYAYYGNRKENTVSQSVDLRKAGTITNYQQFWNFANNNNSYLSRNFATNNTWVWNSVITQYNRKGYEIENKDPLGRFNAGLYGYNQQLPIAVANNSRLRELLYDGFEDYDYNTSQNCISCRPHHFFNYATSILNNIDSTQQHTGRYSLKVNSFSNINLNAPIINLVEADKGYALRMKVDSTYSQVGITGLGLKAQYFNQLNCTGTPVFTSPNQSPNISWTTNNIPIPGLYQNNISIRWTGKLKIPQSSNYSFKIAAFNNVKIVLNGTTIINSYFGSPAITTSSSIALQGGQLYDIVIEYQKLTGAVSNVIEWKNSSTNYTPIPNSVFYSPTNIYSTVNELCARLDSVNVRGNALTDTFSLIEGKKMVISAWVKEGGNDCKCSTYVNNRIYVTFQGGNSNSQQTLFPTGSLIEGWQRYEAVFDVPLNATSVNVSLNNTGNNPVFFDDLRIHPFNANVKSFVYNSSSLRLMSELDENNYASFYEYDDDGTLIRVKKETQRGIKTITETRSATQQIIQ